MSTVYNSNAVPKGGIRVQVYRAADPEAPSAVGDPATNAALLGTYIVETITPTKGVTLSKRPSEDGGRNGWWMVEGDVEGSIKVQLSITATPTLQSGDYFEDSSIFRNSAGVAVNYRFVVSGMAIDVGSSYRSQSGSFIVDQPAA